MSDTGAWRPFALGFRPFFLLGGFAALGLVLVWVGSWHGGFPAERYYGRIGWHAHEMLFGYAVAVIAGFLLTAVRNWTGRSTPTGGALAGLAALWLAGRVAPWLPLPGQAIALLDLLFLPVLALSLLPALRGVENRTNYMLPALLVGMAIANLLQHLEALGLAETARSGIQLMMDLVLALLILIAGRVMPFFIRVAVPGADPVTRDWVEKGTLIGLGLLILVHLAGLRGWPAAVAALLLGLLQAVRLAGWHHPGVWRIPILWVLVTGYGWIVLALWLRALSDLGGMPISPAEHALTVGGIGVMTLGMMARVTLGHTGRPMVPPGPMLAAFVLINLAALVRVAGPTLKPADYAFWILLAGALWIAAFAIFLFFYTPMLLRARVDGRPG